MKPTCPLCQGPCEKFQLICSSCDEIMYSGIEEYSVMAQAISSLRNPTPMSDPWDMVGA